MPQYQNENHDYDPGANYGANYNPFAGDPFIDDFNHQAPSYNHPASGQQEPVGWQPDNSNAWVGDWAKSAYPNQPPVATADYNYDKPRLRDRVSTKAVILGSTALLGLAGTGVGGVTAYEAWSSGQTQSQGAEAGQDGTSQDGETITDPAPIIEAIPDNVRQDFERALAIDECDVRVTAEKVTETYQRLYGAREQEGQTIEQLAARAQQVGDKLTQTRAEQGFIPLPESFDRLRDDALGEQAIPIEEYKQATTDYLSEFGVKTMFEWSDQSVLDENYDADLANLNRAADPAPDNPDSMRISLLNAMQGFSYLAPALVGHETAPGQPAVRIVAFGRLHQADDVRGVAFSHLGIIVFDVDHITNVDPKTKEVTIAKPLEQYQRGGPTPAHEYNHVAEVCGAVASTAFGGEGRDPAYEALAHNFPYSLVAEDQLNKGLPVQANGETYVVSYMERNDPNALNIATRPYGAESVTESKSVVAESLYYVPAVVEALNGDDANDLILKEQSALLVARADTAVPGTTEVIGVTHDAAQVIIAIDAARDPINDEIEKEIYTRYSANGSADGVSGEERYQELRGQDAQLLNLRNQLLQQIDPHMLPPTR